MADQARAAGGAPAVIRPVMAIGWLVTVLASVPPEARAINTDSYRAAATSGSIGVVTGRIYEERKRPETQDHPLAGAAVIVLPKSADVLRKLEEIKRTARNSADDYRTAGASIVAVRRAYEKELWDSGAVDLVKATTVVDPEKGVVVPFRAVRLPDASTTIAGQTVTGEGYAMQSFLIGQLWFAPDKSLLAVIFDQQGHAVAVLKA